jgi:hypothetical protein
MEPLEERVLTFNVQDLGLPTWVLIFKIKNKRAPKLYLAGPMRGKPNFNKAAFDRATTILRTIGFEVFSPSEQDEKTFGKDFHTKSATGNEDTAALGVGLTGGQLRRAVIKVDVNWIIDHADAIAMLPDWEQSSGSNVEHTLAKFLGPEEVKFIYIPEEWIE